MSERELLLKTIQNLVNKKANSKKEALDVLAAFRVMAQLDLKEK